MDPGEIGWKRKLHIYNNCLTWNLNPTFLGVTYEKALTFTKQTKMIMGLGARRTKNCLLNDVPANLRILQSRLAVLALWNQQWETREDTEGRKKEDDWSTSTTTIEVVITKANLTSVETQSRRAGVIAWEKSERQSDRERSTEIENGTSARPLVAQVAQLARYPLKGVVQ